MSSVVLIPEGSLFSQSLTRLAASSRSLIMLNLESDVYQLQRKEVKWQFWNKCFIVCIFLSAVPRAAGISYHDESKLLAFQAGVLNSKSNECCFVVYVKRFGITVCS